jgi:hypothetical protein
VSLSKAEEAEDGHDHDDQTDDVDDRMHADFSAIASGNSDTCAKVSSVAEFSGSGCRDHGCKGWIRGAGAVRPPMLYGLTRFAIANATCEIDGP